jgi:two-component system response regulator
MKEFEKVCKTILLVEDQPDDVFLTLRALRMGNLHRIIVKHHGQEALDFLRNAYGENSDAEKIYPDMIILDINMPIMNGIEMLREMRADPLLEKLPVVVLSSSSNPRDLDECRELGVIAYISKPPEKKDIVEILRLLDAPSPGLLMTPENTDSCQPFTMQLT